MVTLDSEDGLISQQAWWRIGAGLQLRVTPNTMRRPTQISQNLRRMASESPSGILEGAAMSSYSSLTDSIWLIATDQRSSDQSIANVGCRYQGMGVKLTRNNSGELTWGSHF